MVNPNELIINSPDYNALMADGVTPRVSSLVVNVTPTVPAGPTLNYNIGKPAQALDGLVHYALPGSVVESTLNPSGGEADITVQELGPTGLGLPSGTEHIELETLPGPASITLA